MAGVLLRPRFLLLAPEGLRGYQRVFARRGGEATVAYEWDHRKEE
jgi:hypothetical protein